MAIASSYVTNGQKEQILDKIYSVDPTKTPVNSMSKKITLKNKFLQWQNAELFAVDPENAIAEDADAKAAETTITGYLDNNTQLFSKTATVTRTDELTDKYGRGSEMTYQLGLRATEIKRDQEAAFTRNRAKTLATVSTARKTGGFESYLNVHTNSGAGAVEATGNGVDVRTPGTTRVFAEAQLDDVMEQIATDGGDADKLLMNIALAGKFSTFSTGVVRNVDAQKEAINKSVGIYTNQYGTVHAMNENFNEATSAFVLDSAMVEVGHLGGFVSQELAITGATKSSKQLLQESMLIIKNPKAFGAIYDVTAV